MLGVEMNSDIIHALEIMAQALLFLGGVYAMIVRTDTITRRLRDDMKEMQKELKELAKVITIQAVQQERLDNMSRRITILDQRLEDLRHGKGIVAKD